LIIIFNSYLNLIIFNLYYVTLQEKIVRGFLNLKYMLYIL